MNIVLIGLRGSGKTTVGKKLSELFKMNFLDTDLLIEKKANMKISKFINKKGIAKFRNIERQIINNLPGIDNYVIATGGGVVENNQNMTVLKKNGHTVYLK